MKNRKKIKVYAEQHYETDQNLSARKNLWSYGLNPESFHNWIFSKLQILEDERVLELGCRTRQLWLENFKNISSSSTIVLSDFSQIIINKAKENLQSLNLPIEFEIIDAEKISYSNPIFDVVIACHMLYHIPNIQKDLISVN